MFHLPLKSYWFCAFIIDVSFMAALTQTRVPQGTASNKTATIAAGPDELIAYLNLYKLSLQERRALFNSATAKQKSDLWRLHLALNLAAQHALDRQQQEVILEAISLATPQIFEIRRDDPSWATIVDTPLQRLNHHAREVFSPAEASQVLAQIPGNSPEAQDNVIETYASLDSLSMPERKSLFRRASPELKSNLWRLHLSLALVRTPNITPEQQVVILNFINSVTPSLFNRPETDSKWTTETEPRLEALRFSALSVFSKAAAAAIFTTLGNTSTSSPAATNLKSESRQKSGRARSMHLLNQIRLVRHSVRG